jgi:hypothetical protein
MEAVHIGTAQSTVAGDMRIYIIAISVLIGLTLIMSGSDVGLAVVMLTLGLGFPLVFSATGLLYALCAAPAVALWEEGRSARATGLALAIFIIAGVAYAPNHFGLQQAERSARSLMSRDHTPNAAVAAASLEIRRPENSYDGTFIGQDACGAECRAALAGGVLQWVRVVMDRPSSVRGVTNGAFYRALHGPDCAIPGGAIPTASAVCVVVAEDTRAPAELTISFEDLPLAPTKPAPMQLSRITSARAVVAFRSIGGEPQEVLRRTEVTYTVPVAPTLVGPRFDGMHSEGVDFAPTWRTVNKITLAGVLAQLGYPSAATADAMPKPSFGDDWRTGVNDEMTREMIAVLDLPRTEPFNPQQMKPVSNWIGHARNVKDWTPDLVALLRRVARDRRIREPTSFGGVFASRPEVTEALLPDVLDRIAEDGINNDYTPAREAAYTFPILDAALLKPYAARIVGLLEQSNDVRAILLPAIGRLGVDPLPYLTPFSDDLSKRSSYSTNPRVVGACRAEKTWAPELIGPLREELESSQALRDRDRRNLILKALVNLGDGDFARQLLGADADADAKFLLHRIEQDSKRPNPADWLCSAF